MLQIAETNLANRLGVSGGSTAGPIIAASATRDMSCASAFARGVSGGELRVCRPTHAFGPHQRSKAHGDPTPTGAPHVAKTRRFRAPFGTPEWYSTFTNLVGITL
jgi:hypothetical protein